MVWTPPQPKAAKRPTVFSRLYTGTGAFDIVGRRKTWYIIFGSLMLICIASMIFRGFNLGIDFVGGTRIQFQTTGATAGVSTERAGQVFKDAVGQEPVSVQQAGTGTSESILIRTETLTAAETIKAKQALFDAFRPVGADGQPSLQAISDSAVSASWGGSITTQALIALAVFLVLVTLFLSFYFERAMAAAALVALVHDVVVTAGIYSIVGFEVSPSTVIGLLTILGFSLYDTVVVFDKVAENTKGLLGLTRRTYGEAANLALNQTLMRSINTSIFALLPVLGLLYAGVFLIGEGTLQDLALVLFVGMLAGVYSSIFLAAPVLCDLKEREPEYQKLAKRLNAKRAGVSVDNRDARMTAAGDTAVSPMAAAKADRSRGPAQAGHVAGSELASEDSAVETIDPEALDPDDQAADPPGRSGGGGTLVASARRTRPRSTRASAGTAATSTAKNGAATSAGRRGRPAKRNR